ncbi:related to transcription factor Pig1p [Cephalotrichum gorgonifer]|uniref:Related to transcription factor Pig1p n=1 Tax=Cephalotrichum gorgonifer TaxID=2041049 RepID=A0AAE8MUX6_9PEZI|nr:related to transcription factor Pig1p [Cephalotrichum gorgonifer]
MSLSGQSGIDILCDAAAAGSDLLPPLAPQTPLAPKAPQDQRTLATTATAQSPAQLPPISSPTKPAKRKLPGEAPPPRSTPSHVCRICNRVYERADHLTRHLRAHENARPYQCTRCPKRFNRADLLTRHEATHDRDGVESGGRPFIRRSDRASEACTNCAASKSKCEDEKPCARCRSRNLVCSGQTGRSSSQGAVSTPDSTTASSMTAGYEAVTGPLGTVPVRPLDTEMTTAVLNAEDSYGEAHPSSDTTRHVVAKPVTTTTTVHQPPMMSSGPADSVAYLDASQSSFQGLDFSSWDLNFEDLAVPTYDPVGPSPSSAYSSGSKSSGSRAIMRDPARGHEAFKRSPWLWEPESEDYIRLQKEGLNVRDDVTRTLRPERLSKALYNRIRMSSSMRDRLFALVLAQQHGDQQKVPSFPSLGLLNYILMMYFTQEERQFDSWIHVGSFDPSSLPIFIASILSHGSMFVSVPAIWQFGMAIHEVVRVGLGLHFEALNMNTRDLTAVQTYMINLDVGIWSGFKRKMELAEGFLCPLVTMIRRAGNFSLPPDSEDTIPTGTEDKEALGRKWRDFIRRESYKRLALHAFFHDAQASMLLCRHPLISFTELHFSLPAPRDLWMAVSAEQWRDIYLAKPPTDPSRIPNIAEIIHIPDAISEVGDPADQELYFTTILYSYRAQISSYWDYVKLHSTAQRTLPPPWLQLQHQDLHRHLTALGARIARCLPTSHLCLASELTIMTLHVSLDDLQKFAGKAGEAEAHKVSNALDQHWATTPTARHAVFHAGQVLRLARLLAPSSLRDFTAVAVYYASLTLWIYGLLRAEDSSGETEGEVLVLVDGDDSPSTRAFLERGGIPAVRVSGRAEALGSDGAVLREAKAVLRGNYPAQEEAVPPLVESLGSLLTDLAGDGGTVGY